MKRDLYYVAQAARRRMRGYERVAAERALCTCTHTKQRHLFGRKCDMPRCRCAAFEAA